MTRRRQELPGSDEPGTYRAASHIARTQVCAECGTHLIVLALQPPADTAVEAKRWLARCAAQPRDHEGTRVYTTKEMIADKLAAVERGNAAAKGRSPEERESLRKGMWDDA